MIQLFSKFSSYRLLILFIFLLIIRTVAYTIGLPIIEPEIIWNLVGNRMAGGHTLYNGVWTTLEPLSAGTYYLIHLLFGFAPKLSYALALVLVFIQAMIFNLGLNENKAFKEESTLPALMYILFSSLAFDFYYLSPVLLGTTFILLAFNIICVQSKVMTGDQDFFYIGLLIGIASLFYTPYAVFVLFALFALGLYSVTSLKKQLTLLFAFFFPHVVVLMYYFMMDDLNAYYHFTIESIFVTKPELLLTLSSNLLVFINPLLVVLVGLFLIGAAGRYLHYQYKIIKIVGFWLIFSVAAFFITKTITMHSFFILVPPLAYFGTHLILLISKKKLYTELLFIGLASAVLTTSFYFLKNPDEFAVKNLRKEAPMVMQKNNIQHEKILVLGEDKSYYISNEIAGPCVNWRESRPLFDDLEHYDNIADIYEIFEINKPAYIVDEEGRFLSIANKIPTIKNSYAQVGETILYKRLP